MKTKLALAISSILALSACDDYKLASEADGIHSVGTVAISGDPYSGQTLSADISDADGFTEEAVVYSWMADGVVVNRSGSTYELTDAHLGQEISVQVIYTDNAGYNEVAISSATDAIEFQPVQSEGFVAIDGDAYVDYDIEAVISDDNGCCSNDVTYVWMADGVEVSGATESEYRLTGDDLGKVFTVSVSYIDDDGFSNEPAVSNPTAAVIVKPADVETTKVASISDNMTGDAGELRYKKSGDVVEQGKLTVSFFKESETKDGDSYKDAYIALYGSSTSTSNAIIDLRIHEGTLEVRNHDVLLSVPVADKDPDASPYEGLSFTLDEWHDVDITWDASSTTEYATVTLSIDGGEVYTFISASEDSVDKAADGVSTLVFKVGDTGAVIGNKAFLIDDIAFYSDLAGTADAVVFADDFESYDLDYDLDKTNNENSLYHASSAEAVVDVVGTSTTGNEKAAVISDNMTGDAGELRYKKSGDVIEAGTLTVSFLKESETKDGDSYKDAYIALYGSSTSTANAIVDLRIHEGTLEVRNHDVLLTVPVADKNPDAAPYEGLTFTLDEWHDVKITWDASSTTEYATVTLSIDGGDVYSFTSASEDSVDKATDGVSTLVFKVGDTGAVIGSKDFLVDDIKLYSDLAGTTIEFEDDFESYDLDYDLDKTNNEDSVYHASSAEAVVGRR